MHRLLHVNYMVNYVRLELSFQSIQIKTTEAVRLSICALSFYPDTKRI